MLMRKIFYSFRLHEFYEYETEQGFVTFFLNCYILASKQDPLNQGVPISGMYVICNDI